MFLCSYKWTRFNWSDACSHVSPTPGSFSAVDSYEGLFGSIGYSTCDADTTLFGWTAINLDDDKERNPKIDKQCETHVNKIMLPMQDTVWKWHCIWSNYSCMQMLWVQSHPGNQYNRWNWIITMIFKFVTLWFCFIGQCMLSL